MHITEDLDATFNLRTGKYYPYRKQNNSLQYTHRQSNHPLSIIKRILAIISKRLFDISSDKKTSCQSCTNEALKNSGFNESLKFLPPIPTRHIEEETLIGSTLHVAVMLKQM